MKKLVSLQQPPSTARLETAPITEEAPPNPINLTEIEVAFERMLRWYDEAYRLRYISLRCFNTPLARASFGEAHDPETHLIPNTLRVAAA